MIDSGYTSTTESNSKVNLMDQSLLLKIYKGMEHIPVCEISVYKSHIKVCVKIFIQMFEIRNLATWSHIEQDRESMEGLWKSMLYSKVPHAQGNMEGEM